MKLTMVVAMSADGFIASSSHSLPSNWTSDEDKQHLRKLVSRHNLLVFGRHTYESYGKIHSPGKLRVILTRHPEAYADDVVENELVFESLTPEEFVAKYENRFSSCLVLGGSYVFESFLSAGLIEEIYLTVEPVKLTEGVTLFRSGKNPKDFPGMPQPTITRLNNHGTILKHYVLKN